MDTKEVMKDLYEKLHAKEAEKAVLAALIVNSEAAWPMVQPLLNERHFTSRDNLIIWRSLSAVIGAGDTLDPITLGEQIALHQPDGSRWQMVLAEIVEFAAAIDNVEAYAKVLVDRYQRRQLLKIGIAIQKASMSAETAEICYADAVGLLTSEMGAETGHELVPVVDVLREISDSLGQPQDADRGMPYGLLDLDHYLNPMGPGDFIVIGGRPSMGKTTLALNIAEGVAAKGGVVLFKTSEMDNRSVVEKMISAAGRVPYSRLINDRLQDEDWPRFASAVATLRDQQILFEDTGGPTSADVRADALRARYQAGRVDLIVIDYLQLMQGRGDNRTAELSKITRDLKSLAKELECPLILLSQLNREVEKRNPPRPRVSDLRESGSIEQDADVVLLLYRESEYVVDSAWRDVTEIIVAKQRKGPRNRTAYVIFDKAHSKFLDADRNMIKRIKSDAFDDESQESSAFDWQHDF